MLAHELGHQHLVRVHDMVPQGGGVWIVMDLVLGETLSSRLKRGSCDDEIEFATVLVQVASVLVALHEFDPVDPAEAILHRDIKPQNIMVHRAGMRVAATVIDLGSVVVG